MEEKIILDFKQLVKKGDLLLKTSKLKGFNQYQYDYDVKGTKKWIILSKTLIKQYFSEESDVYTLFNKHSSNINQNDYQTNVNLSLAVLESIVYLLENNLTENIIYKDKLNIFKNILLQAELLLKENKNYQALIYTNLVFENTIFVYVSYKKISLKEDVSLSLKNLFLKKIISKTLKDEILNNYKQINNQLNQEDKIKKVFVKKQINFIKHKLFSLK